MRLHRHCIYYSENCRTLFGQEYERGAAICPHFEAIGGLFKKQEPQDGNWEAAFKSIREKAEAKGLSPLHVCQAFDDYLTTLDNKPPKTEGIHLRQ